MAITSRANGASSASEGLGLGGHVGTHIDAPCHFSCGGKLSSYWKEVINFDALVRHGAIGVADMDLFRYADDPDTAFGMLKEHLTTHLQP